jgi:hypothetical protein
MGSYLRWNLLTTTKRMHIKGELLYGFITQTLTPSGHVASPGILHHFDNMGASGLELQG